VKTFTFDFPDLMDKVLSNKTNRGVGITHMKMTLVPCKYIMEVIGH
jgi:hypothetical protein